MTFYSEEETRLELIFSEQLITRYPEAITEELLNLFWGKSFIELKQTIEEVILIDNSIKVLHLVSC
jgi:hypothetical protein